MHAVDLPVPRCSRLCPDTYELAASAVADSRLVARGAVSCMPKRSGPLLSGSMRTWRAQLHLKSVHR